MTTILKAISIFFVSGFLLTSCGKDCSPTINEPTQDELGWLVYRQNDTIRFENEKGVHVDFRRTNIRINTVAADGIDPTAECVDVLNTEILNIIEDNAAGYPGLATYILKKPDQLVVRLVSQPNFSFEIGENTPKRDSVPVGGKTYDDVFEVKSDSSTEANSIKSMLFNKEFGFLKIEYNGGRTLQRRLKR